jgi:hypothetical protein
VSSSRAWDWERIEATTDDISTLLHELRTQALRSVEYAGPTLLSAGAAGAWYFDWIAENYGGSIDRHFGVEAFQPMPPDLPENVVWIASHLDRLDAIDDASVDLVIAGQLVEHLWADELASFLLESWRVLRVDGRLLVDSPNRAVTQRLSWRHPEHTVELTEWEAQQMTKLAGFDIVSVNGLWRCVDAQSGLSLGLEPGTPLLRTRVDTAWHDPSDSFIWWLVVEKAGAPPRPPALVSFLRTVHATQLPAIRSRWSSEASVIESIDGGAHLVTHAQQPCPAVSGPNIALPPGRYTAEFLLRADGPTSASHEPVARFDVVAGDERLASRTLVARELSSDRWHRVELPFTANETLFAVQRRAFTTGTIGLVFDATQARIRAGDVALPPSRFEDAEARGQRLRTRLKSLRRRRKGTDEGSRHAADVGPSSRSSDRT